MYRLPYCFGWKKVYSVKMCGERIDDMSQKNEGWGQKVKVVVRDQPSLKSKTQPPRFSFPFILYLYLYFQQRRSQLPEEGWAQLLVVHNHLLRPIYPALGQWEMGDDDICHFLLLNFLLLWHTHRAAAIWQTVDFYIYHSCLGEYQKLRWQFFHFSR